MKKTLAILLVFLLVMVSSTVALAKPNSTLTISDEKSVYDFSYEVPDYIVTDKDATIKVTFKTSELGSAGYENVRFHVEATNDVTGDVNFTVRENSSNTYVFTNNGYFGTEDGFTVTADYERSIDWKMNFTKPGQYEINFKALSDSVEFAEETLIVIVEDAAFTFKVPETVYSNEETTINVALITEQDYHNMHFDISKAGPGDVVFRAKDTDNNWGSFTNGDTWGSGLDIHGPYNVTTPWHITFKSPGNYTLTYKLENSDDDVVARGSVDVEVKDPTIIDDEDETENDDGIENGNVKGLLNALQNHYKNGKKVNHGAQRIIELLLARGVSESDIDAITHIIESAIDSQGADEDDYKALGKMHQKKGDKFGTYIDGKKVNFDVPPLLKNDRTLVPFRKVAEALGATVSYDDKTKQITVSTDQVTVVFTVGSKTALVNGEEFTLDVPAQVEKGRVLVPLRFLGTALKTTVDFYSEGSMIVIRKNK